MSTTRYLNELESERLAIERDLPQTDSERADWWDRLGNWWGRRDLGFGDGRGMMRHCFAMAERIRAKFDKGANI